MAYADWVFSSNGGSYVTTPTLNGSLTNPLPQPYAGDFARLCPGWRTGNSGGWMTLSPSYAGGAFYNVPSTKALRIQSCIRYLLQSGQDPNAAINSPGRGLVIKSTANSMETSGYLLGLGINGGARSINLVLPNDPDAGSPGSIGFNGRTVYPLLAFNYYANWISLRMDVFPIGTSGDRIICYYETTATGSGVSSPGSDAWTQLIDHFVPATSQNFTPWGSNNRQGVANQGGDANPDICVDKLNVYVSDAP